jgi:hypothetical protein
MRCLDGKSYRQQVNTLQELPDLVRLYGLPQEWNIDGKAGPNRYIEAQVWDDAPLKSRSSPRGFPKTYNHPIRR